MEDMTRRHMEQEREEKQRKLNMQLTARATESPRSSLLSRFRKERVESGRKYAGYAMHRWSYSSSPGESLLQSPVGQHTHNYRYVMRHLAPNIHRFSTQSRLLDSTPAPHAAPKADTAHASPANTIAPKVLTSSFTPPQRPVFQRLPSVLSPPHVLQSNRVWRPAHQSLHLSPMHPVAQRQSTADVDVLTVKSIDVSDLRVEDLKT